MQAIVPFTPPERRQVYGAIGLQGVDLKWDEVSEQALFQVVHPPDAVSDLIVGVDLAGINTASSKHFLPQ